MFDPAAASMYSGPRRERASVGLIVALTLIVLVACTVLGFVIVQVRTRVAQSPSIAVPAQAVQSPGAISVR